MQHHRDTLDFKHRIHAQAHAGRLIGHCRTAYQRHHHSPEVAVDWLHDYLNTTLMQAYFVFSCLHCASMKTKMQAFLTALRTNMNQDELLGIEPTGKRKGGLARASSLTKEKRQEIAKKAAGARWGIAKLQATHKGSFQEDFGIDVECYVLNDEKKTAVISQRGMGSALNLGEGGRSLPRFVAGKVISEAIGPELLEKIANPLIFNGLAQVGTFPAPSTVHGYDVTMLIDICKAIVTARMQGKLLKSQDNIANQAQIILNASAKSGIQNLVYRLSGYDATKEEVVAAFKFFVREEAREYEKEFPDQLYSEWYRLYNLPKPERNKPWKFKHLTIDQVYRPLAKSSGKILQLTQAQRDNSNERYKKLHQFLSDIGVKALRTQLGQLLGIARISKTQVEYEDHVQTLFGDQPKLF